MSQHRIVRYALSSQTRILISEQHKSSPSEILFEDQATLNIGSAKPFRVRLQLTSESLIIRPIANSKISIPRIVRIDRDPITHSFGFSIKGGKDTGFPVLISRVLDINTHLLHIGDAILSINNQDISDLTHDQVISILHDISNDQVNLTIQYMTHMARYLHLTSPKKSGGKIRQNSNRLSAEYSFESSSIVKQKRLSLTMTDEQENPSTNIQEYSLLYAYVSQYFDGTDQLRLNSFQLHTFDGSRTGILMTNTSIEQNMWISRLNMVIRHLTTVTLAELNQTLLLREQVFYANWIHLNEDRLVGWKAVFLVFKGTNLYLFDENRSSFDFISCQRIYSILEIFIETIPLKYFIDERKYCFTLALPNDSITQGRYLNLERKNEYEEFISNYQRVLYLAVHSIEHRMFECTFRGQICRLIIDINKGFAMYNHETDLLLWTFTFEQLQSSSDNGRDQIYFQFEDLSKETVTHIEVECQDLRILVHVINAFLTVKLLGQRDEAIE